MSIIESMEGVAQSISVNHYEKYIDERFVQSVREDVLQYKSVTSARSTLLNFAVDCLNMAQSFVLDIARQQHQTSELSMSSITLRNALIYFLSDQTVPISRYLHYTRTEIEENILLYEHFPKLLATLQMLHLKSSILPCFLHTQDMQALYVDLIQSRLKEAQKGNNEVSCFPVLTVDDILNDPSNKKLYTVYAKNGEFLTGKPTEYCGLLPSDLLELFDAQEPATLHRISISDIEKIVIHLLQSFPTYTLKEVELMTRSSIFHTLVALLEISLHRQFTEDELEVLFEISDRTDLSHFLINSISLVNRKE